MTQSKRAHTILFVSALLLALALQIISSSRLESPYRQSATFVDSESFLLTPTTIRAPSLGHSAASSVAIWISALLYYGDWRHAKTTTPPAYLEDYAKLLIELDPQFFSTYEWFNTTYINSRIKPETEDLHRVADLLERGMIDFPERCELPYMAASNFIGYSVDRAPKHRIIELERAIDLYQRSSLLTGCPESLAFVASYLYKRKASLESSLEGGDAQQIQLNTIAAEQEFYSKIYLYSPNEAVRERARRKLSSLGVDDRQLAELINQLVEPLHARKSTRTPYLSDTMWNLIQSD